MADEGLVSIIVPVYNAEAYVEEAVESALGQRDARVEVIAVDDGSDDRSLEILKRFEGRDDFVLCRHPGGGNRGVARSRRLGVERASGEYIAFLDADDVFEPEKTARQLAVFRERSGVVLSHTAVRVIGRTKEGVWDAERALRPGLTEEGEYSLVEEGRMLDENHICNSTVMVRASVLEDVAFAAPQLFQHEDWVLWTMLSESGRFHFTNLPLAGYRLHDAAFTSRLKRSALTKEFSHLEFLLTLACRARSEQLRFSAYAKVGEVLANLMAIYGEGVFSKENAPEIERASADPALITRLKQLERQATVAERQRRCFSFWLVRVEAFVRRKLSKE